MNETINVSYSLLSLFRNCRRAAYWRYVKGLNPIQRTSLPLYFGTIIHSSLDLWYKERNREKTLAHLDEKFTEKNDDWLSARCMMQGYMSYYKDDFEIIALEKDFAAPILDIDTLDPIKNVQMVGKIDGIVKIDNEYFLLEHKTASKIDSNYIDKLWSDFQIILYCYYANKVLGIKCSGVLYNVLIKSNLKRKEGETEEEYQLRRACAAAKNKSGVSNIKKKIGETDLEFSERLMEFYQQPSSYYRETIHISKNQMKKIVGEISELTKSYLSCIQRDKFYLNTDHCFRYGSPCPYFSICKSGDNENIIENFYKCSPRTTLELITDNYRNIC